MHKRKPLRSLIKENAANFYSPLLLLALWELAGDFHVINIKYFPPPSQILVRLGFLLLQSNEFLSNIFLSLQRLAIGSALAVPLGIILAMAMGLNRKINQIINPLIALTYPIPRLAIFPLLLIIFGIGDASKVAIIFLGVFYLVLLSTIQAIKNLSTVYYDIAFIYRIPAAKKLYQLVFKAIFPDVINGCKIGVSYGLVMMIAGEFIVARNGIGFFMWNAWDQFNIIDLYAGLAVISLIGLAVFIALDYWQSRLKWLKDTNADRELF